ncbi:MAG: hypothetical protein DWQ34_03585 [Planctomycetota bacterium]|nr:MAG: hypothetical protein DWQ34_03585 [Planctomycetota bacterium]REK24721.1 MAG: hypothetical protein DWQ41_13375 [Planctomycetota bacterium]REK29992.1 MAG: hypothetical protein DWQ45_22060 [Planctomycetota bacterium]
MPITATCPKCQKEYRVKDDVVGKKFRCKACQAVVTVPEAAADPGGHKDPWDDLDLDAYGDNPYAETDEPIEAPRARKKSPSKKKRSRSSGMPIAIMVAIGIEGILILLNGVGIVGNLMNQNIGGACGSIFRILIEVAAIMGYVQRQNVVRWISVALSAVSILLVLVCGGIALAMGANLPPEVQQQIPQEMMVLVIAIVVGQVVLWGTLIGCLVTSGDWFDQ